MPLPLDSWTAAVECAICVRVERAELQSWRLRSAADMYSNLEESQNRGIYIYIYIVFPLSFSWRNTVLYNGETHSRTHATGTGTVCTVESPNETATVGLMKTLSRRRRRRRPGRDGNLECFLSEVSGYAFT